MHPLQLHMQLIIRDTFQWCCVMCVFVCVCACVCVCVCVYVCVILIHAPQKMSYFNTNTLLLCPTVTVTMDCCMLHKWCGWIVQVEDHKLATLDDKATYAGRDLSG